MEIIKLSPRGFCSGVVKAWQDVIKTLKMYPDQDVYMLGWFVHNIEMLNEFNDYKNLHLLDDTNTSRYELVKNHSFKDGDVLILSAHGTDEKTIQLAKQKGFIIVDTTCEFVHQTHKVIKEGLEKNKTILYFGKKNHPEAISCLSISDQIHLIETIADLEKLSDLYDKEVWITNQTTMSMYDLFHLYDYVKKHFLRYELKNDLCLATEQRQKPLMDLDKKVDFVIVVGDQKSNNSKSLLKIALDKGIKAKLINSKNDLDFNWFKDVKCLAITSGASTPTKITNEIISTLEAWNASSNH